jgi:hypothetical protein
MTEYYRYRYTIEGTLDIDPKFWKHLADAFGIKRDPIFIAWRESNGEFLGGSEESDDGNDTVEA